MQALLGTIVRWLLRHVLNLLVIIAVLMLGKAVWTEWKEFKWPGPEPAWLAEEDHRLADYLDRLAHAATARADGFFSASLQTLESRVTALDGEIAHKRREKAQSGTFARILKGTPIIQAQVTGLRLDAEIEILEQERSYLFELRLRLLAFQSEQANRTKLEHLRRLHETVYSILQDNRHAQQTLSLRHPAKSRIYGFAEYETWKQLEIEEDRLLLDNRQAYADYQRQLQLVQDTKPLAPLAAFELNRGKVNKILQPLRARIAELNEQRASNWFEKIHKHVEEVAPTAFGVLLGLILTPIAIKVLFYFVLAPLAARRPAIKLLPETSGALALEKGRSAVSIPIALDADHELLVHAEFLQIASDRSIKDTCWLLNRNFPLTSLASGMVALTRIRTATPESFVISATKNPFSEIAILSLPEGAALVMQPHNLVGVVQPIGSPVRITSHWRLGSLHAWLTLQLRYLAFHGPAKLILQGGRGVRIERADAGRSISQAATIGFSANLAYSTRRCEPFYPYLKGKQELLNDTFSGEKGFYVYEETPHYGKKTGMTGRGLEGLTDSLLKVFGN